MTTTANTDVFDAQERIALAGLAFEAKNFAEALRMLKPVLQAADVPAEALALGGAVYMQLRLFDRAEKLFTRCLEKHPKAPWERCQLGMVQAQMGKRTEALNAWEPEAEPVLAVDKIGSGVGQTVIVNSDGIGAREYIGDQKSPARWFVIGIVDE